MDSERLAVDLSSRMEEVLPAGFAVVVDGDMLWFLFDGKRRSGSYACQWINSGQGSIEALTVRACELAVNDLQDFVIQKTTELWPSSGGRLAQPGVRLVERSIEIWLGEHDRPVARLRSLPLDG
jgi:hypothetical protein